MKPIVAVLAALVMGVLLAPTAQASPESDYLRLLEEKGITYDSADWVISYGYGVCKSMDIGVPYTRVVKNIASDYPDLEFYSAASIGSAAVLYLCPEHDATIMAEAREWMQ